MSGEDAAVHLVTFIRTVVLKITAESQGDAGAGVTGELGLVRIGLDILQRHPICHLPSYPFYTIISQYSYSFLRID